MRLMRSFSRLRVPDNVACTVLIVENESESVLSRRRSEIENILPFPVQIELETKIGIPAARNRALDIALSGGFDFLTFVDDDQIVDREWLLMLHASTELRGLDLVGGPRGLIADEPEGLTWANRLALQGFQAANTGFDVKRFRNAFTDNEEDIMVHTNNWMVRVETLRELGTRFDDSLHESGGSDTVFWRTFRDSGGKTGWASDARTTEIWTKERLTLGYFFRRTRDIRLSNMTQVGTQPTLFQIVFRLPHSFFRLLVLGIRIPMTRGGSLISILSLLAYLHADILAISGHRSTLYK